MCYEVSLKRFLGDYICEKNIANNEQYIDIKIQDINQVKARIETECPYELAIDFSRNSLSSLVNSSHGKLSWDDSAHNLHCEKDFFQKINFDDEFPENCRQKYQNCFQK